MDSYSDDGYGDDSDYSDDGGCGDDVSSGAVDSYSDDGYGDDVSAEEDRRQRNYTVLTESDIRRRLEDDVGELAAVLSVSKNAACLLLRHYNWDVGKVHDEWFANEYEVRRSVGLLSDHEESVVNVVGSQNNIGEEEDEKICKICFESFTTDGFFRFVCGHAFCKHCCSRHVSISIVDGSGCLGLRCPEPTCRVVVDQDAVNSLVSDDFRKKYGRFLLRSYVERSRRIKWCPAPGCEYAVEYVAAAAGGGGDSVDMFDVSCDCSSRFCWNCTAEAHRPVSCETVRKWMMKNRSDGENVNWILANSKPCPKCCTPIEKNQGCMHMTCRPPCGYEFCWLCLGAWKSHADFYSCNVFNKANKEGAYIKEEKRKEMAKRMVEKYAHYYERWCSNHSSREKAIADMNNVQAEHLEKIGHLYRTPESQLKFIMDAWSQIVECRRVLKWSYAYGYYMPEDKKAEKSLFEYLQGQAEPALERLHHCVEKELQPFFRQVDSPLDGFQDFRIKLIDLTVVTKNYFDNLVRAFANDLADICFDGNKVEM